MEAHKIIVKDDLIETLYPDTCKIILTLTKEDVEQLNRNREWLHGIHPHWDMDDYKMQDIVLPLLDIIIDDPECKDILAKQAYWGSWVKSNWG